jgi:type 1 glutamine amidotransferase
MKNFVPHRMAFFLALPLMICPLTSRTAELTQQERNTINAALPSHTSIQPKTPRHLLVFNLCVWDGKPRQGHASIADANYAIAEMGEITSAYETTISSDIQVFRPESLKQFDAICFNNTSGVLFEDPELRQSLLDFVRNGKGFIGIHAAGATFVQWPKYDQFPEFGVMLGGYENGGHPWKPDETITLRVEEPTHPVNRAFKIPGFKLKDEVFQFQAPYSRKNLRVLLSIDPDKTDMSPGRRILPERMADRDLAISWVKDYEKGRVFYTSLGHNRDIFWNQMLLTHILDGIQFAIGDLKADAAPRK